MDNSVSLSIVDRVFVFDFSPHQIRGLVESPPADVAVFHGLSSPVLSHRRRPLTLALILLSLFEVRDQLLLWSRCDGCYPSPVM